VLDVNIRARDDARAHTELAQHQLEAGSGSLLNELRAAQLQSSDEVLVEQAGLDLARAQEALGVLMAAPGPVDAVEEPQLEVPASVEAAEAAMPGLRTDVRLAFGREQAARRVVTESWKDWLPSVSGAFQPQVIQPTTLFDPYRFSWRAQVFATVPIFDAGTRRAVRAERQVVLEQAVFEREGVVRQARSDVRIARVAVDSAVRALASARTAADQAHQVVRIVDVAFQAGSSTDIEVIDAQLAARNADTAAAVAEDQLRQARLALLLALGLFPGTP
jgi:outer membrane protein TolC